MTDPTYDFISDCQQPIIVSRMRDETSDNPIGTDLNASFAFGVKKTNPTGTSPAIERMHDYSLTVSRAGETSEETQKWAQIEGHTLTIIAENLPQLGTPDAPVALVLSVKAHLPDVDDDAKPTTTALIIPVTASLLEGSNMTVDDNSVDIQTTNDTKNIMQVTVTVDGTEYPVAPEIDFKTPGFVKGRLKNTDRADYMPDDDNRPAYLMCSMSIAES